MSYVAHATFVIEIGTVCKRVQGAGARPLTPVHVLFADSSVRVRVRNVQPKYSVKAGGVQLSAYLLTFYFVLHKNDPCLRRCRAHVRVRGR